MIRKAQIIFVTITMSIVFLVLSAMFAGARLLLRNAVYSHTSNVLDDAFETFLHNSDMFQVDKIIIENNYICSSPETESDALKILETAKANGYNPVGKGMGNVGNYFFKFYDVNGGKIFVAADMTEDINMYNSNTLKILFALLSVFFSLFVVVYLLSFKVFEPIKETLEKQKRFISDASHELKTPLTIISANADVLKQTCDSQWLDNIKSQTERMDNLVSDMLTLAKLDERKAIISEEPCDVSQLVLDTALPFDAVAFEKNKTLTLDIKPDIKAVADRQNVKKITSILIDNAIKHSYANGEIKVSVYRENNKVYLTVFNTGSDIPDDKSDKIFERFYRGDKSRSRESGGSGLGLSIAKSIADNNKWKINAQSKLGESMKITVTMPAQL